MIYLSTCSGFKIVWLLDFQLKNKNQKIKSECHCVILDNNELESILNKFGMKQLEIKLND